MHADLLILIGILTPLLVAIVATVKTSSQIKGILALIVSVVIGLATAYASDLVSAANVLGSILAAYGAAQVAYVALFKPLGITSWILDNLGRKDAGA
jgi:hypothetical protein